MKLRSALSCLSFVGMFLLFVALPHCSCTSNGRLDLDAMYEHFCDSLEALGIDPEAYLDSLYRANHMSVKADSDTLVRRSVTADYPSGSGRSQSTYNDDDNDESESSYAHDGHPGTKPDDPLFGFDPWDDEDDAYNVERNQQDPYPDEW